MKCPKCGFNSFEYYDSCKKCSTDLTGYKQTYSIASLVLPLEAKVKLAAEFNKPAESVTAQTSDNLETHNDIFSFDLQDDSPTAPSQNNDDPFNFDEPATAQKEVESSNSDDDVFANLLETTSQSDESPFADSPSVSVAAPANPKVSQSSPGEFDLESFSWDETPASNSSVSAPVVEDDFDSLFGDTKENITK